MIYLIGIDHLVQYFNPAEHGMTKEFVEYVTEVIQTYKIKNIFDEWTIGAPLTSHVEIVAHNFEIPYLRMDPDKEWYDKKHIPLGAEIIRAHPKKFSSPYGAITQEEKHFLDTEKAKYFSIREDFWYEKINGKLSESALIICGTNHISIFNQNVIHDHGFDLFLKKKGYSVTVLPKRFDGF